MVSLIKRHWFLIGLVLLFAMTLADVSGTIAHAGIWLKTNHGPELVVFAIFFFSGLVLNVKQIRGGLRDVQGTAVALALIFIAAPLIAAAFAQLPLAEALIIGVFLVAVMPTTLSSGVVMTGAAGGNMAHALLITIISNTLAIVTIPWTLTLLLNLTGKATQVTIDKGAIMFKLAVLVVLPLMLGLFTKLRLKMLTEAHGLRLQIANQLLVLMIVWMALSPARATIINSGKLFGLVCATAFCFHGLLLAAAGAAVRLGKIGRGRMESVIFMGGQKTLPLSVILQVTLFPQYGLALVFCVLHHIIHLMMDSYLVGRSIKN